MNHAHSNAPPIAMQCICAILMIQPPEILQQCSHRNAKKTTQGKKQTYRAKENKSHPSNAAKAFSMSVTLTCANGYLCASLRIWRYEARG